MHFRRLAALLLMVMSGTSAAQTVAPVILRLPAGPRTLGLGNTGVASRDDEAIFFNPAQLAVATGYGASGEWIDGSFMAALSAVTRFNGTGGVAIGGRFANYQSRLNEFPATRENMSSGGTLANTSLEASIGGAQVVKGIRIGVVLKYAEETDNGNRIERGLADVGFSKDLLRSTFGLSVQNIGKDFELGIGRVYLPLKTTLGVAQGRSVGPYDLFGTAAVSLLRGDFVQPSGGLEVNYSWLSGYNIAVRGGLRRAAIGERPFTAGAGFTNDRLTIDYAMESLTNNRMGHRFGLRVR